MIRILALCLLACVGCGSSASAKSTTPVQATAPHEIPVNPLDLIPAGANQVLTVGSGLRGSPHFDRWVGWVAQLTCVRPSDAPWLLQRTELAAFANFPPDSRDNSTRNLLVVRGAYTDADATEAITQLARWAGIGTKPLEHKEFGPFTGATAAPLSAVRLDDHTLAIGDTPQIQAMLDLLEGKGKRFVDGGLAAAGHQDPDAFGLTLVAEPSEAARAYVSRKLQGIGASLLAEQGSSVRWISMGLAFREGMTLNLRIGAGDEPHATQIVRHGRRLMSQADLFLRLAGLPALTERAQTASTPDGVVLLSLNLDAAETASLSERLEAVVETFEPPKCGPDV